MQTASGTPVSRDGLHRARRQPPHRPVADCPSGDPSGDGQVRVEEMVAAVRSALDGCPLVPISVAAAHGLARALFHLGNQASPVIETLTGVGRTTPCDFGGESRGTCEDAGLGAVRGMVTLEACGWHAFEGPVRYDGATTIVALGTCPDLLLPLDMRFQFDLTTRWELPDGGHWVETHYGNDLVLHGLFNGPPPCTITGGDATLNGEVRHVWPGGGAMEVDFDETQMAMAFEDFITEPLCEPRRVRMTVNGALRIEEHYGDPPVIAAMELENLVVARQRDTNVLEVAGVVHGPCFGGRATVSTPEPLRHPLDRSCLAGGSLRIDSSAGAVLVSFTREGGILVDAGADGVVDALYPSCFAPPRQACG